MKILELCHFSAGICGVWARVREEAKILAKNHEIKVFSSNSVKGSNEIATSRDKIDKIEIMRFPFKKFGGESFMSWDFQAEALNFNPDLIIAHSYRQLHTTKALKIAKKINSKVFLVTHAPFLEDNSTRSFLAGIAVNLYDSLIGPRIINKFDKVIAITHWEMPYLEDLGCKKDKIVYIPNSVPDEFFKINISNLNGKKILFLGRISPIKYLETLIRAIGLLKDQNISLDIVGPREEEYYKGLKQLVENLKLENVISFKEPVYDLKDKIKAIQSADIFVLPSKSEAMPQALIEAMALGRIVIASDNRGAKDIVQHGENGFLFKRGDYEDLAQSISFCIDDKNKKQLIDIQNNARKSVKKFSKSEFEKKLNRLIH